MNIEIEGTILAAKVRPGHCISLTGLESDKIIVRDINPKNGYSGIEITWEEGTKIVPIDYLVNIYKADQ